MPHLFRTFFYGLFIANLFFATASLAEIYKWQDEKGRWHFSDDKKQAKGKVSTVKSSKGKKGSHKNGKISKDLHEMLFSKYQPNSTIEEVTLSVVGIETALGQGSGFFVSSSGHIITNKHVLRPSMTKVWKEGKENAEEEEGRLKGIKIRLDEERDYLEGYAKKLAVFKSDVDRRSEGSAKALAVSEYQDYERQYQQRNQDLLKQQSKYENRVKLHRQFSSDFSLKSSMAGAARTFTIYLKDNTKLSANLVRISDKYDLALLKLEGYISPKLVLGNDRIVRQGNKVFAVGSPLGMRDSVTSGIIARKQKDYLVTDAQILPGNSGGPLLNEAGEVIGVNTLKFAENRIAKGFGLAIPASAINSEFQHEFQ